MADLTKQGRHRTALALRKLEELDYEATGQLPKPYKPKRRTKNPPVIRPALGWLMSLPMQQAARERQRKAERRSNPHVDAPGGDWDVAVIVRSSRRSRRRDWLWTLAFLLVLGLIGAAVGPA